MSYKYYPNQLIKKIFMVLLNVLIILSNLTLHNIYSQTKIDIKELSSEPKVQIDFSLYYNLILPSLDFHKWEIDFNTIKLLNPRNEYSVGNYKDIKDLHARMDTSTTIKDLNIVVGTWRSVCGRIFEIKDSISNESKKVFRKDKTFHKYELDDGFIILNGKYYIEFLKLKNEDKFDKRKFKYKIIDGRYLQLSKFLLTATYFIGVDSDGFLILQYAEANEKSNEEGKYKVYASYIDQIIFKKVN